MSVAVIGCGHAGVQHAPAVAAAGGHVAAVCDLDVARARELACSAGAQVRTPAEVLADPAIDAVAICLPPDLHLDFGLRALDAGKAVVIEKPVALAGADARELSAAAEGSGLPLAAMLQHRGRLPGPALAEPWGMGASATVEVYRHRPPAHYRKDPWRSAPERSGGGIFAHLGVHYVDLACQLLGGPAEVAAIVDDGDMRGIDARVALCARTVTGGFLSVQASALTEARSERLRVLEGRRELLITPAETRYGDGDGREHVWPAPSTAELRGLVYAELFTAIRERRPVERYGVATAVAAVALIEAVLERLQVPAR